LAGSSPRARVALLGDSFTFGLEVSYADSWGQQLERQLGDGAQVLNFGVDGYGVDQASLKYERQVRAWRPDVVILSIVDHDIERTMGVYAFLTFPGAYLPFPKPRMVLDGDGLRTINVPLPPPHEIFSAPSIDRLPFVRFDRRYDPWEWQPHVYHHSYVVRFLQSQFPRWPSPRPEVSDDQTHRINAALLRTFVERARADGATPLLVYFPSRTILEYPQGREPSLAHQVLHAAGLPFLDLTECVRRVPAHDRFVVLHYSRAASAAVAGCLRDVVRGHLASRGR
jgi:hypothetical protein